MLFWQERLREVPRKEAKCAQLSPSLCISLPDEDCGVCTMGNSYRRAEGGLGKAKIWQESPRLTVIEA